MATQFDDRKAELLQKLISSVDPRHQSLKEFIRRYYAITAPQDIVETPAQDLYGAALSHWNHAANRKPGQTLIRVYNPDFELHGWQSTHSVVEIVTDDKPFIVDSVVMELNRHGLSMHIVIHPVIKVIRENDKLIRPAEADESGALKESFIHCEVDRQSDENALNELRESISSVLKDVEVVVTDWRAMRDQLRQAVEEFGRANIPVDPVEAQEAKAFLQWLATEHFILLGHRQYDLAEHDGATMLKIVPDSGQGVLRGGGDLGVSQSFTELPPSLRELARQPTPPIIVSKSSARATVHRPGHMDYIGIKRYTSSGEVCGEWRFLGLYTSAAYNLPPREIPLLRHKFANVVERSNLPSNSHAGKALAHILDSMPRDELFQMDEDQLLATAMGILHLQERQTLRLFVRLDPFRRFVSCLVYVPRERYDTAVRIRMQTVLCDAFNGTSSTFATQFSESILARVQFHIRTDPKSIPEYSVDTLEQQLRDALLSWNDEFSRSLTEKLGEAQGTRLFNRYGDALPGSYKEDFKPRSAVNDVTQLEELSGDQALTIRLYQSLEDPQSIHLKVLGRGQTMALSDALPILERLGMRVITARPYRIEFGDQNSGWILAFDMRADSGYEFDIKAIHALFSEAFTQVWHGQMENDDFNRLVSIAKLNWRDVAMLRAYCKYLLQTRVPFSQAYMQQTLVAQWAISAQLVELFHSRFDPAHKDQRSANIESQIGAIEQALETVESLDEDRILRRFLAAIQATLRTNFFQMGTGGGNKPYMSFKFDPSVIPEMPLPLPMYEIFVYSPRVEAVHLRGGPAARGGLRWSDRREDFRTEVLGLMKAQMVKNAVIVPVGSKGGFVVKRPPALGTENYRESLQQEVRDCYTTFIRGMLDITDNRTAAGIEPPAQVVRHDGDDPYLVVAADKGTATFSDLANSVAAEYQFWLGDAFASGGANGYDHKKMGITARGAWESVKRHFRELDMDIQNRDTFTVVGIGDMSGDVFGNGMLLSRKIKLVAAFNHLNIFLDPDPDPAASFSERQRLFELPRSSWTDYDRSLISAGGGIFPRSAKSISLSPQVRERFAIDAHQLTPQELIHHLLKTPIDLLWNGGIGTYVKAKTETHLDVGDKANDALRVNGEDLNCRVVGEGGNLGLTQLGRIEFALRGGKVLTDAIDNSAGVNCSDHEVNIKILLDQLVSDGELTEKHRNRLLADMTEEVGELVLRQNYLQPGAISTTLQDAALQLADHTRTLKMLEDAGRLNRALEYLPDEEALAERVNSGIGLTGPELAVLLAYSKIMMFDAINGSELPEDPYLQRELRTYFPSAIRERFPERLAQHPLAREIIATYTTNSVLNRMGSAYLIRLLEETGENAASIATAYTAARDIFQARELWAKIDALDNQIRSSTQIELHRETRRLLENTSHWLLRNRRPPILIEEVVSRFATGVKELRDALPALLPDAQRTEFEAQLQHYSDLGIPKAVGHEITGLPILASALDIIDVAQQHDVASEVAGRVYFAVAAKLELSWLKSSIGELDSTSYWQRRARSALMNNLNALMRTLCSDALQKDAKDANQMLARWLENNRPAVERSVGLFNDLRASGQQPDLAMLSVALREAANLAPQG